MFKIERKGDTFPIKQNFLDALIRWGKELHRSRVVSVQGGSLSYRYGLGFVVTAAEADLTHLTPADLVLVEEWNAVDSRVVIRGSKEPAHQSFLHGIVYQNRSAAIFTFFVDALLTVKSMKELGLPATDGEYPNPFAIKMDDVERKLGQGNILVVQNQGILSWGCTAEDAGTPLLTLQQRVQNMRVTKGAF